MPKYQLSNNKLNKEFPEWSVDKISEKTGINNRFIAAKDETASDLAYSATEKLFDSYDFDRNKIDFIIFCTQSPDYFLPTTACILQEKLKLSINCGAIDINQGCSGYVYSLALAKSLLSSGVASNILLLTGDTYSKYIYYKDKKNRTIFGDAATASIVALDELDCGLQYNCDIGDFVLGTDGSGSSNLIVKNGGMKNRRVDENVMEDAYNNISGDSYLFMNGAEIFNFTLKKIPVLINDVLDKHNLRMEDVDLFIFHQANKFMLDHLRKKLKISEEKFYINLENSGNTVSSTIPIALHEALVEEKIKKGNRVLVAGFGVGYSWGATILTF